MSSKMALKVYLVLQRVNLPKGEDSNVRILAAKLTRDAAQKMSDDIPGTWIEKQVATK
jgi:hypothetical protein